MTIMSPKTSVWITKHVLTRGIYKLEGEIYKNTSGKEYFRSKFIANPFTRNEFYLEQEQAFVRAKEMLENERTRLNNKISIVETIMKGME